MLTRNSSRWHALFSGGFDCHRLIRSFTQRDAYCKNTDAGGDEPEEGGQLSQLLGVLQRVHAHFFHKYDAAAYHEGGAPCASASRIDWASEAKGDDAEAKGDDAEAKGDDAELDRLLGGQPPASSGLQLPHVRDSLEAIRRQVTTMSFHCETEVAVAPCHFIAN